MRRWWEPIPAKILQGRPLPDSVFLVSLALVLAGVLGVPIKVGDAEVTAPGEWWGRAILVVVGLVLVFHMGRPTA